MTKITMSLNEIRKFNPCEPGFRTLLRAQGGATADYDRQIPLEEILESNGIQDVIWCFRVNWFEHKDLYMQFVDGCAARAKKHAADDAVYAAVYAAYAADAAYAANAAAYAADAATAERNEQTKHLLKLLADNI